MISEPELPDHTEMRPGLNSWLSERIILPYQGDWSEFRTEARTLQGKAFEHGGQIRSIEVVSSPARVTIFFKQSVNLFQTVCYATPHRVGEVQLDCRPARPILVAARLFMFAAAALPFLTFGSSLMSGESPMVSIGVGSVFGALVLAGGFAGRRVVIEMLRLDAPWREILKDEINLLAHK